MKRKFDSVSRETEKKCINEIITRIEEIEGGDVGIIAAQDIIEIVTQNLGPEIYNNGLNDAKKLMQGKFTDLETDISLLEQSS
jgi:uncharacterized protein (DUF2164 family)